MEIKNCMQVCTLWNEIISKQLKVFTIKLVQYEESSDNNIFPVKITSHEGTSTQFLSFVQIKNELDKSKFKSIFLDGMNRGVSDPLMKKLINKYGYCITSLCYKGEEPSLDSLNISTFYEEQFDLMREKLTCLQQISFKPNQNPRIIWADKFSSNEGISSLKEIYIFRNRYNDGLNDAALPPDLQILLNSPNLTCVYGFPLQYIPDLEELQKVNTIKSFFYQHLNHFTPKLTVEQLNIMNLESMLENQVQLEDLPILDNVLKIQNKAKITNCLQQLLYSSQNSMKQITIEPTDVLKALHFPIFQNLENLILYERSETKFPFFPYNLNPNDAFPNVRSLELAVSLNSVDKFNKVFPSHFFTPEYCLSFKSLNHLKISAYISPACFQLLAKLFPHVKKVTLSMNDSEIKPALQSIFQYFSHLSSLNLELHVGESVNSLDSVMVGMNQEDVNRFRKLNFFPDFWKFKTHASILDMSDLKHLNLMLYPLNGEILSGKIFTKVFSLYGLDFMPHVNFKIGFLTDISHEIALSIVKAMADVTHHAEFVF